MVQIDIAAILESLSWWHLLWVLVAAGVWGAGNKIGEDVAALIPSNKSYMKKRIGDLELKISDVRRYLIPMQTWGLDEHTNGHIKMLLHITESNE